MALVNMAEAFLRERLDKYLKDSDCCKCEACYVDMLAYALNQIKPLYVNTRRGALMNRVFQAKLQNTVEMDVAAARAIEVVGSNPHRDVEEGMSDGYKISGYDDNGDNRGIISPDNEDSKITAADDSGLTNQAPDESPEPAPTEEIKEKPKRRSRAKAAE